MRNLDCPAHSTQTGIQCKSCGKCVFTQLKKDAEKYGYKVFILTGSSYVKNILKMEAADGVLLIACDYEINKVMRALKGKKVITYGVPMENDGCFGTFVIIKTCLMFLKRLIFPVTEIAFSELFFYLFFRF